MRYKEKININQLQHSIYTFGRLRNAFLKAVNETDNEYLELPMPKDTEKEKYLSDAGHLLVSKKVWSFYQDMLTKVKDKSLWKKGEREMRPNQYGLDAIIILFSMKMLNRKLYYKSITDDSIYKHLKKCKDVGLIREVLVDKKYKCNHIRQVKYNEFIITDSENMIKFLDFHRKLGIQIYGKKGKQASIRKKIKIKTGWKYGLMPSRADIKHQEEINSAFASWLRLLFETATDDKITSPYKRINKMLEDYDKIKWVHIFLNEIQRHGFTPDEKKSLVYYMPILTEFAKKQNVNLNGLFGITDDPDSIFNTEFTVNNVSKIRTKVGNFFQKRADKSGQFLSRIRTKVGNFTTVTPSNLNFIQALKCLNKMLGNNIITCGGSFADLPPASASADSVGIRFSAVHVPFENLDLELGHSCGIVGQQYVNTQNCETAEQKGQKMKKTKKSGKVYKTGEAEADMDFKKPIRADKKIKERQAKHRISEAVDDKIDFMSDRVQRGVDPSDRVRGLIHGFEVKKYDAEKERIYQAFLKADRHAWFDKPEFLSKVGLLIEAYEGPLVALMQQLEALDKLIKDWGGQSANRGRILKAVEIASSGAAQGKYTGCWYISDNFSAMRNRSEEVNVAVKKSNLLTDDEGNDKTETACGVSDFYRKRLESIKNTSSANKTAHERTVREPEASDEVGEGEKCGDFKQKGEVKK